MGHVNNDRVYVLRLDTNNQNVPRVAPQNEPRRTPYNDPFFYDLTLQEDRERKYMVYNSEPITTYRLPKERGMESNTKKYMILNNGAVQLFIINKLKGITNIYIVSRNGRHMIKRNSYGAVLGNFTENYPPDWNKKERKYLWFNIPQHLKAIYNDMRYFVFLIKSDTSKIIYYSDDIKFFFMENGIDMEGIFTNGIKIKISMSKGLEIIGKDGRIYNNLDDCNKEIQSSYEHFKTCARRSQYWDHYTRFWPNRLFPVILRYQQSSGRTDMIG